MICADCADCADCAEQKHTPLNARESIYKQNQSLRLARKSNTKKLRTLRTWLDYAVFTPHALRTRPARLRTKKEDI